MSPPVLTSALLAQQAIAAAASAPASRSSSRPRTFSGGKDLLREDVCDLSDQSEDDDTDLISEEDELIDERFLDPNSDEGIATRVAAYARELSAPAKRFLRTFPVEVLRNATAYLERLEGDDLVLEARKGDEVLCLRRTNFQDLCFVDETRPLLQTPLDADPTASLADLLRRGDIDSVTATSARSPVPRRHPHPPSPADDTNPPARSRIPDSVRRQSLGLEAYRQLRSRPPRQPTTSSAPITAVRSGFNYEDHRARAAANAGRFDALMQSFPFHVATERRGTTALGRLLGDEPLQPGATSNAGDAVTTVEQDGQRSTVRVSAPERGVEFEMVLYEEEEVEEEQEGADDPAAEEAEREREETERREASLRVDDADEIGR